MSIWELALLAFGAIRAHKLRSFLTTLGITIGVLTVIGMLALIDGLNKLVGEQLSSIGSTTLYVQKFAWVMNRAEFIATRGRKNITIQDADAVRDNAPSVQRVAPMLTNFTNVRYRGQEITGVQIIGTTPDFLFIQNYGIDAGRQLTVVDQAHSLQNCMIGATVMQKLFGGADPLGRQILINRQQFTVIALLSRKGSFFGNDEDNIIIIPISVFTKRFSGQITDRSLQSVTIAVQPIDDAHISSAQDEITAILRRTRKVPPEKPNDFNINTADELLSLYRKITAGVFGLMVGVTVLSLVVGGIGIMNIMLVSVSERIREIGIRKALGARRRDIRSQFLIEAITLSVVGGIIGMGLGFGLARLVSVAIKLPATVSWWSIVLGFGFSGLVGVFFGWYPAAKAAGMNPIEALRHE
jgi:putative ABC transport system permease protein